jgi:hypothetical protein
MLMISMVLRLVLVGLGPGPSRRMDLIPRLTLAEWEETTEKLRTRKLRTHPKLLPQGSVPAKLSGIFVAAIVASLAIVVVAGSVVVPVPLSLAIAVAVAITVAVPSAISVVTIPTFAAAANGFHVAAGPTALTVTKAPALASPISSITATVSAATHSVVVTARATGFETTREASVAVSPFEAAGAGRGSAWGPKRATVTATGAKVAAAAEAIASSSATTEAAPTTTAAIEALEATAETAAEAAWSGRARRHGFGVVSAAATTSETARQPASNCPTTLNVQLDTPVFDANTIAGI